MKIISATIHNFRLLKDVELDFSTDNDSLLTVIRAENETGKTTIETALIWGLYGSKSLPSKGTNFALYPSDSIKLGHKKVEISVQIEFEADQIISLGRGKQEIKKCHYRLLRSCIEHPSNDVNIKRENESILLFEITPSGADEITGHRILNTIESSIPVALKDIYFTDGDKALSFIDEAATQGIKRRRVKNAVESLLGLDVLEKTKKHLSSTASNFTKKLDDVNYSAELVKLTDSINGFEEDLSLWNEENSTLEGEISEGKKKLLKYNERIESILKLGDREKIISSINRCKSRIDRNKEVSDRALGNLSSLFKDTNLASSLISDITSEGLEILTDLKEKKQLPKVNIPILEELLDRKNCFCGSDLSLDSEVGKSNRKLIGRSIEDSQDADALSEAASSLYYSVRSNIYGKDATQAWIDFYSKEQLAYQNSLTDGNNLETELADLNDEIDKIKDSNLEEIRSSEKSLSDKIGKAQIRMGVLDGLIKDYTQRKLDKEFERGNLEKKSNKTDKTADKLRVARLCEDVFEKVFDRLRVDELKQVSIEMNRIFLDMIGSNPEKNDLTMITKAELTEDFDIVVHGPNSHVLNPDQDLNGASRRAITLAFILALTKVSKVVAPNVIDTPFGMMSGYVKRAVLSKILEEGTQVILFLTHAEINGIEDIIDDKAGRIYTITNPAHYPEMLINRPTVEDARVMRCECSHRQTCEICERRNSIEKV